MVIRPQLLEQRDRVIRLETMVSVQTDMLLRIEARLEKPR
jgi:hypothetical protein